MKAEDCSSDLEEWIIMALDELPADSMSLLPHAIALVDVGDRILVRVGPNVNVAHGKGLLIAGVCMSRA